MSYEQKKCLLTAAFCFALNLRVLCNPLRPNPLLLLQHPLKLRTAFNRPQCSSEQRLAMLRCVGVGHHADLAGQEVCDLSPSARMLCLTASRAA
jgi:hypothetical protein